MRVNAQDPREVECPEALPGENRQSLKDELEEHQQPDDADDNRKKEGEEDPGTANANKLKKMMVSGSKMTSARTPLMSQKPTLNGSRARETMSLRNPTRSAPPIAIAAIKMSNSNISISLNHTST
jgi:hypothetical protein